MEMMIHKHDTHRLIPMMPIVCMEQHKMFSIQSTVGKSDGTLCTESIFFRLCLKVTTQTVYGNGMLMESTQRGELHRAKGAWKTIR